jgi:DNA-binding transcriptional MerR regulator
MELPFFGKKKKPAESKGRGYMPTDRSKELMGKGFSELDTIDVLRREGFSPDEIDKALTQVVKEGVVGGGDSRVGSPMVAEPTGPVVQPSTSPQDFDQAYQSFRQQKSAPTFPPRKETPKEEKPERREEPDLKLPTIEELQPARGGVPAIPETALPEEYYQGYPTEEYIDYVVQERTQDVLERLNEFSYRNKELENKLNEMNERVRELSKVRINEQQQVLSNIDGLGESINDVNVRMASLEKAFKETLPALIESVRGLTDLVHRLKREA